MPLVDARNIVWTACFLVGCATEPAAQKSATLGGSVAARVGRQAIPAALVLGVAEAQRISQHEALRRLVDDAVAAEGENLRAGSGGFPPSLGWKVRAALAKATSDRILAQSRALGAPTDTEVAELSARHWRDVDCPEGVRVVHALVKAGNGDPGRLRSTAGELRDVLAHTVSADDFLDKAKAFSETLSTEAGGRVSVVAEALSAFAQDGRTIEGPESAMASEFAQAAFALKRAGDVSSLVESQFGIHVIRLVERVGPRRLDVEARRELFAEEAHERRALIEVQRVLREGRRTWGVERAVSSEALMRSFRQGSEP